MKFTINMLDDAARRELIENNHTLGGMVYEDMTEGEMHYIIEQLDHVKPGLKNYSVGPASHNYLIVDDALAFLDGLEEMQKAYCTLPDSMEAEIKTVLAARDRFRSYDMSYNNLYQLSDWLDRKAQYFADHIAQYFERCLDFSHADMVSYFLEFYADERMDSSYYIENGKLYRTVTREIA